MKVNYNNQNLILFIRGNANIRINQFPNSSIKNNYNYKENY